MSKPHQIEVILRTTTENADGDTVVDTREVVSEGASSVQEYVMKAQMISKALDGAKHKVRDDINRLIYSLPADADLSNVNWGDVAKALEGK